MNSNSASEWAYYKILKKEMQKECIKARNSYMNKTLFDPFMSGKTKNVFRYIKSVHIGITMVFLHYKKME